jgi:hypothetical protein
LPSKKGAFENVSLSFSRGGQYTLKVDQKDFIRQLLNQFFGSRHLNWDLRIDEKEITGKEKEPFFYIPNSRKIPGDIRVKDLIMLFKRLLKLPRHQVAEVIKTIDKNILKQRLSKIEAFDRARLLLIISRLVKAGIYIFIDFAAGVPGSLRCKLADLAAGDAIILDFLTLDCYWLENIEFITVAYHDGKYKINR